MQGKDLLNAIKNLRKEINAPRGDFECLELVLYGIRECRRGKIIKLQHGLGFKYCFKS